MLCQDGREFNMDIFSLQVTHIKLTEVESSICN